MEVSKSSPSLPEVLSGIGGTLAGVDRSAKELLQELSSYEGVQARMDGIIIEGLEGVPYGNSFFSLIKDYLNSF